MRDRLGDLKSEGGATCSLVRSTRWYDQLDDGGKLGRQVASKPLLKACGQIFITITEKKWVKGVLPHRKTRVETKKIDDAFVNELKIRITNIEHLILEIRSNTKELTSLHTSALISAHVPLVDKIKMGELEKKSRSASSKAAVQITSLERDVIPEEGYQHRIHSTQLFQVRKSFTETMARFEAELQRYADGLRKLVAKEIFIATGAKYDEAEVEDLIADGRIDVFVDNHQARVQEAKGMLSDVSIRYAELANLENSITEVRNLFVHMAVLIAIQGDMLDSIEAHVLAAADRTEEGRQQLKKAKKKQKSSRKKKIILGSVASTLAAGLLATVTLL